MTSSDLKALAFTGVLATALFACRSKVDANECTEMLDRYIEMTIAQDPAFQSLTPSQADAVREMKKAVKKGEKSYRQVHDQCETEVHRDEYRCAMKAPTANDWEACID